MRLNGIIALVALLAGSTGCTQPVNDFSYINLNRLEGWKDNTELTLNFDIVDTTGACEIYLAGEMAIKRSIGEKKGYPLNLTFIAPDSTRYSDSIILPLHVKQGGGVSTTYHGVKYIEWPYRKNIYNSKPGQWRVVIAKADTSEDYSNIIGMGIYCKQRKP